MVDSGVLLPPRATSARTNQFMFLKFLRVSALICTETKR